MGYSKSRWCRFSAMTGFYQWNWHCEKPRNYKWERERADIFLDASPRLYLQIFILYRSSIPNQHPFPAKSKPIFPNMLFWNAFLSKNCFIFLSFYLFQRVPHSIRQLLFVLQSCTLNSSIMPSSPGCFGSSRTSYLPKPLSRFEVSTYLPESSTIRPRTNPW